MSKYAIKDLEKLTGVKAHTIRIWEKRYGIVTPERTDSNIRFYSDNDLKRLLNISILNKRGIKISSLAQFSDEELREKVMHLVMHDDIYKTQIESLIVAMIDLDEAKFEKVFSNTIIEIGFEDTLTHVIYPFFTKVGLLWQTDAISPVQEHFVSNLVRQKIIAAIDNLEVRYPPHAKVFILFLPEHELHELGLLLFYYLIKKVGHKTIYLGQATPLSELSKVTEIHKPDYLLTSFTTPLPEEEILVMVKEVSEKFFYAKMFLAGTMVNQKAIGQFTNVEIIEDPSKFKEMITMLLR